jgi:hypothetical protein
MGEGGSGRREAGVNQRFMSPVTIVREYIDNSRGPPQTANKRPSKNVHAHNHPSNNYFSLLSAYTPVFTPLPSPGSASTLDRPRFAEV